MELLWGPQCLHAVVANIYMDSWRFWRASLQDCYILNPESGQAMLRKPTVWWKDRCWWIPKPPRQSTPYTITFTLEQEVDGKLPCIPLDTLLHHKNDVSLHVSINRKPTPLFSPPTPCEEGCNLLPLPLWARNTAQCDNTQIEEHFKGVLEVPWSIRKNGQQASQCVGASWRTLVRASQAICQITGSSPSLSHCHFSPLFFLIFTLTLMQVKVWLFGLEHV